MKAFLIILLALVSFISGMAYRDAQTSYKQEQMALVAQTNPTDTINYNTNY